MDIKHIRNKLAELAPKILDVVEEILDSRTASDAMKMRAVEMVLDRIGLPALKASVTANLQPPPMSTKELLDLKERLTMEQADIHRQIQEIQGADKA